jgi:hypothetical protein
MSAHKSTILIKKIAMLTVSEMCVIIVCGIILTSETRTMMVREMSVQNGKHIKNLTMMTRME